MTITCSNCERDYDPGAQSFVVACPFCGHRTFNPYVTQDNQGPDDDRDPAHPARRAAGEEDGG